MEIKEAVEILIERTAKGKPSIYKLARELNLEGEIHGRPYQTVHMWMHRTHFPLKKFHPMIIEYVENLIK